MSLSGTPLLWVLGLLTIGLPVLALVLWSRVSGPRGLVLGTRLVLVVSSQLAAVLLVGAALNDYAYFYGSWHDLFSSVSQTFGSRYAVSPVIFHRTGSAADPPPAGVTQITPQPGYTQPSRWPRTGRLETVQIRGDISQLSNPAYVYLPPQYFQARYRHTAFPGVELLSGYPSTDKMLVQRLAPQRKLRIEIAHHRAEPMVLVMMRPTLTYPRDTECTDVPGGPQVETYYAQDVPRAVAGHYRVAPTGWGFAGVSTGGYCATKVTMDHPSIFRAAVSLSGYYQALKDYTTGDLWGGSSVVRNLNSPEWRLQHQPAPPVSLLVTSSRDEGGPYGYQDTRRFLSLVRPPMQVSTLISPHGGHDFSTWAPDLPKALHWLSARLHPGRPGAGTSLNPGTSGPALGVSGRTVQAAPQPAGRRRSGRGRARSGGPRPRRAAR